MSIETNKRLPNDSPAAVLTFPVGTKLVPKMGWRNRAFKSSNYHNIEKLDEVEIIEEGRANSANWQNPQAVIKVKITKGSTFKKSSEGYYNSKTVTGELDKQGRHREGAIIHLNPKALTRVPIPEEYVIW